VGDGIEYREFSLSGPNNVFVSRLVRANTNAFIESTIGQGRLSGGTETVRNQASRYDDAINYWGQTWGQRNDAVVAINGSYYNTTTGVPHGGVVHSGWYAKRYDNVSGMSGFVWQLDRDAYIGECITHYAFKQLITYVSDGSATQKFQGINQAPGDNELIVFTPQYDADTGTDNTGSEVLVELSRPALLMPTPNMVTGVVKQVRQNAGSTQIPFDHVVLSAKGTAETTLLNYADVGDTIGISQEIKSFERDCSTPRSLDWTKSYGAVSGNWVCLNDDVIQYGIDSSGNREPRTAIALNNSYVFYIVCDGRDPGTSIGMTIDELAEFCKYTLGATWGLNQDGGGSSTMVVNGTVMNNPSDGSERAVSNGLMMVNILPKVQSSAFGIGNEVKTTTTASVRLGPGTNYAVRTTLPANQQGLILDHALKGVYAKGEYWWRCDFSGTVGWVEEDRLTFVSGGDAPTITGHPSDRSVALGGTATFTVQATGTAPLSYRWQKNSVDLDNGGHYAGVTTNTLTVSDVAQADVAAYRCRVTNAYGSATSDEAALTIISVDYDEDGDVDLEDFACLQLCLGVEDVSQNNPDCVDADLNDDDNVDQVDLQEFIGCMNGAGIPPAPGCLD